MPSTLVLVFPQRKRDDHVVREHVCQVILRIGREVRTAALTALGKDSTPHADAA